MATPPTAGAAKRTAAAGMMLVSQGRTGLDGRQFPQKISPNDVAAPTPKRKFLPAGRVQFDGDQGVVAAFGARLQ
jgi:hypothetical protein